MEDMIPIDWSPENLEIGDAVAILVTPQGNMQLSLGMQWSGLEQLVIRQATPLLYSGYSRE